MNAAVFLPPAAAILIVALWIGPQRGAILEIQSENEALESRIASARLNRSAETDPSFASRMNGKSQPADKRIDWAEFAARQAAVRDGGVSDMRAMVHLQKTLLALSVDELAEGLDELATLDLSPEVKRHLESALLGVLAEKDPQLALERFADRIGDDRSGMSWQLAHAFNRWAAKDGAAAAAWMDGEIDKGTFDSKSLDGKNRSRLQFEAALLKDLIISDPDAAARRLANLPEDQRAEVFQQGALFRPAPGGERATADLIRSQVPEADQLRTLGNFASHLADSSGFERVGDFISKIDARPDERAEIVKQALEKVLARQDQLIVTPEATREWIVEQAPDDAERLTGEALGHMANMHEFSEMADLALQYRESSGSDEVLVAFLRNAPDTARDEVLALADQIADPEQRDEVTRRFVNNPNRESPAVEITR